MNPAPNAEVLIESAYRDALIGLDRLGVSTVCLEIEKRFPQDYAITCRLQDALDAKWVFLHGGKATVLETIVVMHEWEALWKALIEDISLVIRNGKTT